MRLSVCLSVYSSLYLSFCCQIYHPERKFLSASEWMADRSAQGPYEMVKQQGYAVLVTDTSGHFATTLVLPSERRVVVFNTMNANVLSSPIFAFLRSLFLEEQKPSSPTSLT